jgi:Integrase zinc binding domain
MNDEPIIFLHKNSLLLKQFLHSNHKTLRHPPSATLLAYTLRFFWGHGMRKVVKQTLSKCLICKRYNHKRQLTTQMSPLPIQRLENSFSFVHVAIDFAGPIKTLAYRQPGKPFIIESYICVFTCLTSRALHLQPANDATALSTIAAFIRFFRRRGIPNSVISYGAHCLIGTQEWLNKTNKEHQLKNSINGEELEKFIQQKGICWSRSQPEGPHHNGSAEAAVKIVKRLLLLSIGQQLLTMAELNTLLCEVKSIANA